MNLAARSERRAPFKIDLSGVFMRRTDLSNAQFGRRDFTGARNLTHSQIESAIIDDRKILPTNFVK